MATDLVRTIEFVRTLRTPHSERFLLRAGGADIAAIDIHFRPNGAADATVILFEEAGIADTEVPALLSRIDEVILPDISIGERNLSFTVVSGRVLGAFQPDQMNASDKP